VITSVPENGKRKILTIGKIFSSLVAYKKHVYIYSEKIYAILVLLNQSNITNIFVTFIIWLQYATFISYKIRRNQITSKARKTQKGFNQLTKPPSLQIVSNSRTTSLKDDNTNTDSV